MGRKPHSTVRSRIIRSHSSARFGSDKVEVQIVTYKVNNQNSQSKQLMPTTKKLRPQYLTVVELIVSDLLFDMFTIVY